MKYQERANVCVCAVWEHGSTQGGGHEERPVCILCLKTLRHNKLRRHLETLHPNHMHVFFLVELYHLCNKVIIIEFIFSLFLKKYRLMEECSDKCHQSATIKLNLSKVIALFFEKSDKYHKGLFEKGFLFAHQKFLKVM